MAASRRFSVVVPLLNDRESGHTCVKSWLKQTLPSDEYEIVLISPTPDGASERSLRGLLRPHDRLLGPVTGCETALWDHGARQAGGDWLLLSESHCVAHRRCLEEMLRHLTANDDLVGACCQSRGIANSPIARLDEHYFQLGFQQAVQPGNWRKLVMHGCALRRRIYLEMGGLDGALDRFGESVLESRLHQHGYRLGYAPKSIVLHVFRTSVAELIPHVAGYTTGECRFQAANPQEDIAAYTCWPLEWRTGFEPNTRLARDVARVLCHGLWRASWRGKRGRARLCCTLPALCRLGVSSDRLRSAAAWLGMHWAMFQSWLRRADPAALDAAYHRFTASIVRWARYRFLADQPASPMNRAVRLGPRPVPIADLPDESFVGFHCLEQGAPGVYRWSRAVGGLEFHLEPGAYRLRVATGGLRGNVRHLILDIFFNRHRVPERHIRTENKDLIVALQPHQFANNQPQRLVLVCQPMYPARHGSTDRRELGVPVLGLEVAHAA